ncbi:hypothetical protein D3C83_209680 [compost metagenome]
MALWLLTRRYFEARRKGEVDLDVQFTGAVSKEMKCGSVVSDFYLRVVIAVRALQLIFAFGYFLPDLI